MKRKHKVAVWHRDNWKCRYCGKSCIDPKQIKDCHPDMATVDHVKPKSAGGHWRPSNLVTACFSCNQEKGNAYPTEGDGWALGRWQPSAT